MTKWSAEYSRFNIINNKTDTNYCKNLIENNQSINLNISIWNEHELDDAIEMLNKVLYEAAYFSTPQYPEVMGTNIFLSTEIRELIRNKHILRRINKNNQIIHTKKKK